MSETNQFNLQMIEDLLAESVKNMCYDLSEPGVRVKKGCINQNETEVFVTLTTTIYMTYGLSLKPSPRKLRHTTLQAWGKHVRLVTIWPDGQYHLLMDGKGTIKGGIIYVTSLVNFAHTILLSPVDMPQTLGSHSPPRLSTSLLVAE